MLRRVGTHVGQNVAGVRQIITSCTILRRHHEDLLTSFAEQTQALNEEFAEVFGEQAVELDGSMKPISSGQRQFSPRHNDSHHTMGLSRSREHEHETPNGPVVPPPTPPPLPPPPLPPPPLPPPPPPPSPPPPSPPSSYANHADLHHDTRIQAYDQHHAHQYPHVYPYHMHHQHYPGPVDPLNAYELRQLHEAIERVEAKLDMLLRASKK